MSAAEGLFVQYSVVAVFGSVLGCVMLPLITQSYESLIFSMVLIGLTAPRFYRKAKSNDQHGHVKDVERGSKKNPETSHGTKKKKKVNLVSQQMPQLIDAEEVRRRREEELRRTEEDRKRELEKREEEKREKKARKKMERMKRKEQEKLEKERVEEERHRRSFERAQRRLANSTTADLDLFEKSCADNVPATVKRASSNSSISSSCSNASSPNPLTSNAFSKPRSSGNSAARSPTATHWHAPKPLLQPYSVSYNDSGPTITECAKPMKRPIMRGSSAPQVINSSSCWRSKQPSDSTESKTERVDINQDTQRCEAVPVYTSPHSTEDLLSVPIQSRFTNSVPQLLNEFNYQTAASLGHASAPNWRLYSLFGQGNVAQPAFGPVVQPCSGPANHMSQHVW